MPPRKKPAPTPDPEAVAEIINTNEATVEANPDPKWIADMQSEITKLKREIEENVLHGEPVGFLSAKPAEPTFVLHRATRGSQRTFLMATYPCEKKHEHRVNPLTTSDGEFIFRVPQHCPVCGDVYYYFRTEGDDLKAMDHAPLV